MVAQLQKESDGLLLKSNENLMALKKYGNSLSIDAKELTAQMKGSLETSEAYSRELKSQASMVADCAANTAEHLSKAVSTLTGHVDDIGRAANDVTLRVDNSNKELEEKSSRLIRVSQDAIENAHKAASVFGKQSDSLFKASQDAMSFADDIKGKSIRNQREHFMSSSKFVIESLHSLSVDLTRMIDGEVSEKTWKAFQKGDVAAFTRKLVHISDNLLIDKARDKFANDSEFRTYVQRFLRQFEELYEQAQENDHGALLSATFSSSDMGKLYSLLCKIAGKESRIEKAAAKAA